MRWIPDRGHLVRLSAQRELPPEPEARSERAADTGGQDVRDPADDVRDQLGCLNDNR